MKYHYVYKITILETGQYYIGVRSCDVEPEEDNYLGSGTIITAFHRKLNRDAFRKEIIKTFDDRADANMYEKYLISFEDLSSAMVLNSFGTKRNNRVAKRPKYKNNTIKKIYNNKNLNSTSNEKFNRDGTVYRKYGAYFKYYSIRNAISEGAVLPEHILKDLGSLSLYEMVQSDWWSKLSGSGRYYPNGIVKLGKPAKQDKLTKSERNRLAYFKKCFTSSKLNLTKSKKLKVQLALEGRPYSAYQTLVSMGLIP